MANNNEQLTRDLHGYFSQNQFEKCLEMASDDIKINAYAIGMTFNGKDQFMGFMQGFKSAFPDMVINHTNILSSGNKVAVEFTAKGTHTGTLHTPGGDIPATGKPISLNVSEFYEWDDNGKLKSFSNYQDIATLLRQIGAM
jgi:steroid delta-isomerase-like uncharacterized protein